MKKVICLFLTLMMLLLCAGCVAEEPGTSALGLSAPWNIYVQELKALFEPDPAIQIVYDEDAYEVKLLVEGDAKAEALSQLLPMTKEFGNITLKITIVPANDKPADKAALLSAAFEGNPVLSYIKKFTTPYGDQIFVVFQNKVVQYFTDNMLDINGFTSTLYQELAKEFFGLDGGLYYCTDLPAE